jgi:hypothetical protein
VIAGDSSGLLVDEFLRGRYGMTSSSSSDKPRSPEGWHSGPGWRSLAAFSCFTLLWAVISVTLGLKAFGVLSVVVSVCSSFLAGYCFRQQVLSSGKPARLRFLRLAEDSTAEGGIQDER